MLFILFFILVVLWFALSGYFTMLPVVPGIVFIIISIFLYKKIINITDNKSSKKTLCLKFILYIPYIIKEIFISNLNIAKVILKNNPNPKFIKIDNNFNTTHCATIFANSLTLTPGSIAVEATKESFIIHTIEDSAADGILNHLMENRVKSLEE